MQEFIFATGMFRSGTTLLGTMLNAHPDIGFSLDPYQPFFKEFRTQVAEAGGFSGVKATDPLHDYYFDADQQALMQRIQETSLDLTFNPVHLERMRTHLASYAAEYSPLLPPLLPRMHGKTFADVLESLVDLIAEAYASPTNRLFGFKLAWTDEFAPHVLKRFPGSKVIHLVRDPRATCASKNVTAIKYPWLFLIRQWRKLATLAWASDASPWRERILLLKYEDLIAEPEREARRICSFLGVPFRDQMIDPTTFVDGAGAPWAANTSYGASAQTFNRRSLDRWQEVLAPAEIELIERLCFAEMRAWGYHPTIAEDGLIPDSMLMHPPLVAPTDLAEWIRPSVWGDPTQQRAQMALEHYRGQTLHEGRAVSEEVKRALCLVPAFYDAWSRPHLAQPAGCP